MGNEVENLAPDGAPAAAENTGTTKPAEHMIPKSRFDEVNSELKALRAKLTGFEQAQMTETERLRSQAEQAKAEAQAATERARKAMADAAISRAAAQQGIDPALLARLVDVEFDADGMPVNVEANVGAVLAKYPQLKPATATGVAATNPARVQKLTMDDIRRMTPDQINARWDEVQIVMAGG